MRIENASSEFFTVPPVLFFIIFTHHLASCSPTMPLEDGTNKEGEDLVTTLPYKSKSELDRIILYGTHASPATCKTRALLNLAGVDYERRFGKHPSSSYRKFPVVVLNDQQQINDSHIIFRHVAPILFEGYTPDEKDIEIEKMATFGLMLSCEKEAFADIDCMKRWAATAGLVGMTGFFVRNLAPLSLAKKGAENIARKHPDLKTPLEYCTILKQELDQRGGKYFHGDSVGPLDASVYGAMAAWAPGGENTMPFMVDALSKSGMSPWYNSVSKDIPNMWKLHGWFPFYT
jgi:glutathione S-transferase